MPVEYRPSEPPEDNTDECRFCGNPIPSGQGYCGKACWLADLD